MRDSINPAAVDSQLAQVPREMFNVGGDFTYKSFSGSLIGRYVSKRYGTDVNSDTTTASTGHMTPISRPTRSSPTRSPRSHRSLWQ